MSPSLSAAGSPHRNLHPALPNPHVFSPCSMDPVLIPGITLQAQPDHHPQPHGLLTSWRALMSTHLHPSQRSCHCRPQSRPDLRGHVYGHTVLERDQEGDKVESSLGACYSGAPIPRQLSAAPRTHTHTQHRTKPSALGAVPWFPPPSTPMTTQPWAGTGGKALAPRAQSTEEPQNEEQTDNTITGDPGGGLCGTTAHPTLRIRSWGPLAQGASGFKWGTEAPGNNITTTWLREAIPRHAQHQCKNPEEPHGGGGWGQQGWAWSESSVLRQACPHPGQPPRPGLDAWSHTQPIFSFTGETGSLPLEGRKDRASIKLKTDEADLEGPWAKEANGPGPGSGSCGQTATPGKLPAWGQAQQAAGVQSEHSNPGPEARGPVRQRPGSGDVELAGAETQS